MRIFVTVGNALVPFDRLLRWVDEATSALAVPADGLCQHGPSEVRPRALTPREHLSRAEFEREMDQADVVVCHAGVGTLADALRRGHRPIVAARRAGFGEIVNDHQLEIVTVLGQEGRIEVAEDAESLRAALLRYARGEARRGAPRDEDPARLLPVARAIAEGPARARPPLFGKLAMGALAALGPSLDRLRVR
ncbi:glycosyltransferase [Polyangium sp. 6x1]|uniref:glycosyltransferase n=1 Tax=Polyangium sp. 6x1 TaxID=3042689 RepID=UPI002482608F|nr:glycosyltransferase [Polyangium sp. 6x1]MDI1448113.1 glycosyltransferase [Polyangium sp. 6x1]